MKTARRLSSIVLTALLLLLPLIASQGETAALPDYEAVQSTLYDLGYLERDWITGKLDENLIRELGVFQERNGLPVTSEPDEATLTMLASPEAIPIQYVYIPTKGGKKYHGRATCSKMSEPDRVSLEDAIAAGFTQCGRSCGAPLAPEE